MEWQEIFDETYQAPYYWNEKTGETVWDKPAAMSAPAAASAPPATEEISQEEYAELLRLAGQPAAAQPAAAAKPAGGGGMFGGMFGGAAARSGGGGGLISPVITLYMEAHKFILYESACHKIVNSQTKTSLARMILFPDKRRPNIYIYT